MDFDNESKKRIAELIGRVRKILTDTLAENNEIREILGELDGLGLKVNLNFIALVGNMPQHLSPGMPTPFLFQDGFGFMPGGGDLEFKLTEEDQDFLKGIGISFEDDKK